MLINEGHRVQTCFTYSSKAFDSINDDRSEHKIKKLAIAVDSFLGWRTLSVRVGRCTTVLADLVSGMPHGWVPVPTHLLIFVGESTKSSFCLSADDFEVTGANLEDSDAVKTRSCKCDIPLSQDRFQRMISRKEHGGFEVGDILGFPCQGPGCNYDGQPLCSSVLGSGYRHLAWAHLNDESGTTLGVQHPKLGTLNTKERKLPTNLQIVATKMKAGAGHKS